jgi:hypothetical protein
VIEARSKKKEKLRKEMTRLRNTKSTVASIQLDNEDEENENSKHSCCTALANCFLWFDQTLGHWTTLADQWIMSFADEQDIDAEHKEQSQINAREEDRIKQRVQTTLSRQTETRHEKEPLLLDVPFVSVTAASLLSHPIPPPPQNVSGGKSSEHTIAVKSQMNREIKSDEQKLETSWHWQVLF